MAGAGAEDSSEGSTKPTSAPQPTSRRKSVAGSTVSESRTQALQMHLLHASCHDQDCYKESLPERERASPVSIRVPRGPALLVCVEGGERGLLAVIRESDSTEAKNVPGHPQRSRVLSLG